MYLASTAFGGLRTALSLLADLDDTLVSAAAISVGVSTAATFIASALGLPLGFLIAVRRFRGKRAVVTILNTLLALPTVVVGLLVYSVLRRNGILGQLDLLFSPGAMIIGQVVLALPLVVALSASAVSSLDPRAREAAILLGATRLQTLFATVSEARRPLAGAVAAAGGRLIGEVGVSMMLGGNIAGYTRNMTTAIALETSKGEFSFALSLGIVLMAIALGLNFLLRRLQREEGGP